MYNDLLGAAFLVGRVRFLGVLVPTNGVNNWESKRKFIPFQTEHKNYIQKLDFEENKDTCKPRVSTGRDSQNVEPEKQQEFEASFRPKYSDTHQRKEIIGANEWVTFLFQCILEFARSIYASYSRIWWWASDCWSNWEKCFSFDWQTLDAQILGSDGTKNQRQQSRPR